MLTFTNTRVTDGIFKLTSILMSAIYQTHWFHGIHWNIRYNKFWTKVLKMSNQIKIKPKLYFRKQQLKLFIW